MATVRYIIARRAVSHREAEYLVISVGELPPTDPATVIKVFNTREYGWGLAREQAYALARKLQESV